MGTHSHKKLKPTPVKKAPIHPKKHYLESTSKNNRKESLETKDSSLEILESSFKTNQKLKYQNLSPQLSQSPPHAGLQPHNINSLSKAILSRINSTSDTEDKYTMTFKWTEGGKNIFVSGTFCDWKHNIPWQRTIDGTYELNINLPIGKYQYKYYVDDKWVYSEKEKICTDGKGNVNNIVDICAIAIKPRYITDLEQCVNVCLRTTTCPIFLRIRKLKRIFHNDLMWFYINFLWKQFYNSARKTQITYNEHLWIDKDNKYDNPTKRIGIRLRVKKKIVCFVYYKPIVKESEVHIRADDSKRSIVDNVIEDTNLVEKTSVFIIKD